MGYVETKKDGPICKVLARLTPQTSVNNTPYHVSVSINEESKSILGATCNCQAPSGKISIQNPFWVYFHFMTYLGNCKHQTALIFWLLRRSEEPSPTEVACYWKKSVLSTIKNLKAKTVDELSGRNTDIERAEDSLLKMFIDRGKDTNKTAFVIRYSEHRKEKTLYIDHLMLAFMDSRRKFTHTNFINFCS